MQVVRLHKTPNTLTSPGTQFQRPTIYYLPSGRRNKLFFRRNEGVREETLDSVCK